MESTKQVIVMRTRYPDGRGGTTSLRKGKLIAQGCHASMAFMGRMVQAGEFKLTEEQMLWFRDSFAKVCLQVDTEEELLGIYERAREAGLTVHLITDSGRTEFHGTPTKTCLAIGPHFESKIDAITGDLKLY